MKSLALLSLSNDAVGDHNGGIVNRILRRRLEVGRVMSVHVRVVLNRV
jgi:hypothetical protein